MEESILHAKQAVSLDIKDGQSWCKFPIYFPKFTESLIVYILSWLETNVPHSIN